MVKLDFEKLKKETELINKTIHEIKSIESIRNRIENELSLVINPTVTKAILNGEKEIFSLSNEEMFSFFEVLYKKTKDERFNPLTSQQTDREVTIENAIRKMFNPEFKEKFLKEHTVKGKGYSEETKRVARVLFGKIAKYERDNHQDIYEFDKDSFKIVLKEIKASTIRSLQSSISTIEQYIKYAIVMGKINKSNVASLYSKKEDIIQFIDKNAEENMILTKSEIDALSGYSENAQDGVILNLLFDGISHKRKFIELRNIRIQDVNKENLLINIPQLVDEDTGEIIPSRKVHISKETLTLINAAMEEKKYASVKGESKRNYKIADSDYILRGLRNNYQIKWENVNQRILRIAKIEGYPYLNATNIAYSGQIHYAKKIMDDEGFPIDEACRRVMKRFNISPNESAFFYLKARIEKAKNNIE